MSLVAMAFLWTGSQIPVYIFGAYLVKTAYLIIEVADFVRRHSTLYLR